MSRLENMRKRVRRHLLGWTKVKRDCGGASSNRFWRQVRRYRGAEVQKCKGAKVQRCKSAEVQ